MSATEWVFFGAFVALIVASALLFAAASRSDDGEA